ncbi:MAG: 3-phosphoshikimate 1-carboxyvinyltransferase [Anaerolineales bacterium]|nr:MAG: 3-phosphoshikimate 1-carboxyvinyltransferase [Anaerolineales bacterium]
MGGDVSRLKVEAGGALRGSVRVPGDKSISHRTLLLGALADGESHVRGFLRSGDCLATMACVQALGVEVVESPSASPGIPAGAASGDLVIAGRGLRGLVEPKGPLDCVRSGTTMRLLAGILAGQSFECTLTGDPQLLRRPMGRIVEPLRRIGAEIEDSDGRAPLTIHGRGLRSGDHVLAVASAQVKSALLLGGLYADGPTTVHQPGPARDHTERMLAAMGADIETDGLAVTLRPTKSLSPLSLEVPGDFSSAAYLLVAALLVPGSEVTLEDVGVNWTRTGLLDVLVAMGSDVALEDEREQGGEPVADLIVRAGGLSGVEVCGDRVVRMIDEFPMLAVAATQARGTTVVRDAAELRVKETDRIATVVEELSKLGARIEGRADGFVVEGPTKLGGGTVSSHGDHRLAMALAVAGLVADGEVVVQGAECIDDSFPGFVEVMVTLGAELLGD